MTEFRLNRSDSGFIAMLSLILLLIFGILGVSYWLSSRLTTDMILTEAHRIKARNLAQAAVETVKINIFNQYSMNNHDLNYPSGIIEDRIDKEYHKTFPDGEYRVISVKPYEYENLTYNNVPHYQKGVMIGHYDIWEIEAIGLVQATGVQARQKTLVKVYRDYVVY